jgi:hypothetical protein
LSFKYLIFETTQDGDIGLIVLASSGRSALSYLFESVYLHNSVWLITDIHWL